ncbi:MAG: hypothetical protein ABEJ56_03350 [Candidatus Nanohaloarchaea archaeon]
MTNKRLPSPPPKTIDTWDFDIKEFLEESQENEKQRLENELKQIEEQLEQRQEIHKETIDELESKLDWYLDQLEKLYKQHRGKQGRRDKVKTRIEEFYQEIREEKQRQWRARQDLESEIRQILRNLDELDEDVSELF